MHELGILFHIVKTVTRITEQNGIETVRHIALEVGSASGFVPRYLRKLFPVSADGCHALQDTELRISSVDGTGLLIKEIGY